MSHSSRRSARVRHMTRQMAKIYAHDLRAFFPDFPIGHGALPPYCANQTYENGVPAHLGPGAVGEEAMISYHDMCEHVDRALGSLNLRPRLQIYPWYNGVVQWCHEFNLAQAEGHRQSSGRAYGLRGASWWQTLAIPDAAECVSSGCMDTANTPTLQVRVWNAVADLVWIIRNTRFPNELSCKVCVGPAV